jgi:hypothetical protein
MAAVKKATLIVLLGFLLLLSPVCPKKKRFREGNYYRGRFSWEEHMETFPAHTNEFTKYHKLTMAEFDALVEELRPFCSAAASSKQKKNKLSVRVMLSLTLRLLAGASYLDLQRHYKVSKPTIYKSFHVVLKALDLVLPKLKFAINDESFLRDIEAGFSAKGPVGASDMFVDGERRPFGGIVGAIDGIAVRIIKPRAYLDGILNPVNYYNRKCFFALNVMCIVDSNKRFMWMSAKHEGATHDSTAFASTTLCYRLQEQAKASGRTSATGFVNGTRDFFLVGDDAFLPLTLLLHPGLEETMVGSLKMHITTGSHTFAFMWSVLLVNL